MSSTGEKILVSYLKQGSSKAFEQLFLSYHKKLYHYCRKILGSREESENVVQSVFMEVWESRLAIDEEKSFGGYVFRIAKNMIYNSIRKRLNEKIYLEYITGNNTGKLAEEEGYEYKQLADAIENLMDSMPERRREIFRLSRDKGLTYKEIAAQLHISENTVDTQIRNALDFLRMEVKKIKE